MSSIHLCPRPKPFWVCGAWWWYVLQLHRTSLGLQAGTITGSWYQVPGTRDYIREHSSIYVQECRVYTGYQSITCLLRTGTTYKYAFIFSYMAPGALFLLLLWRKWSTKLGSKEHKKARKSPPRELGYNSTSYQDQPPQQSPGLLCFWTTYLGLCCCCCAHFFIWRWWFFVLDEEQTSERSVLLLLLLLLLWRKWF